MIYTGIDGEKRVSVDYSVLKKRWNLSDRVGRKVYVVPSHLSLVRIEETDIKDTYDLKKVLQLEIEERFGENVLWDAKLKGNRYCLTLIRDFELPEDAYSLESEIFSLARVPRVAGVEDCYVLDIGRRKTTLVRVSEGGLSSYRVVLKGGDYITGFLSEKAGIDRESAERVKLSEGVKNPYVREAFENILISLGRGLEKERVFLSGGGSKLRGIEEFFGEVLRNNYVSPELSSAFGASLKFIYEDCSPDFREEELSERDIKKVVVAFGASILLFLTGNLALGELNRELVKEVRRVEKKAFKKSFPELPPIAVRDQLRSMLRDGGYELTEKLSALAGRLKEGMEIYRLEFKDGKLKVVGMVKDEKLAGKLGAKSVKKTPEGDFEFEVEIE